MDRTTFDALRGPEGAALLAAVGDYDETAVLAVGERLRRDHDAALVAAAMTQAQLRRRARVRFGADAARMFFTLAGLEQATRRVVAERRARRLAALGVTAVTDLCCGIGGDTIALARAGLSVHAVDRDPLTCAVLAANAEALGLAERVRVTCADVADIAVPAGGVVFVDPARRDTRGRVFDPAAYAPPLEVALDMAGRAAAAVVKTAPGLPHELIPPGVEAEWVSVGGEVKEAALWFGSAAVTRRRATLLRDPAPPESAAVLTASADPPPPPVGPVGRYLYEPDGAVIRAGLVAAVVDAVRGRLLDPRIAYATADEHHPTPFARAYTVEAVLPFQLKRLRAALLDRGVGRVTVKKRGVGVDPRVVQARLRLSGPATATLCLTRIGEKPTALLVAPLEETADAVAAD